MTTGQVNRIANRVSRPHKPVRGFTDEWATPQEIQDPLGIFDLDPCAMVNAPWPTARRHYTINDDGLLRPWFGRVFLNPPYGPKTGDWLKKLALHGNGIALIFARTETRFFHDWGWDKADAMLFLKGRIHFCLPDGTRAPGNAGGPSVLIAYGAENARALRECGLNGRYVGLK